MERTSKISTGELKEAEKPTSPAERKEHELLGKEVVGRRVDRGGGGGVLLWGPDLVDNTTNGICAWEVWWETAKEEAWNNL